MQPLADLKVIRFNNLRLQCKNPGTVLIVRAIGQPSRPEPLLPILNVIEDDTGEAIHIEVYFPITSPPTDILSSGNILAIKTPQFEMGSYGPVIKVVHPSDILALESSHELVHETFVDLSGLSVKSVWDWKDEAEAALEKRDYKKTINSCSNTLGQSSDPEDAVDLLEICNETRRWLREERDGVYDFAAMAKEQIPINHASFTNLTEIRTSSGRGRGLFAKVDIPRGGLVLCEKAFGSAEVAKTVETTRNNAYAGDDRGAQLWLDLVQKACTNSCHARRLLGLYAGPTYSTQTNVPFVDGRLVINVYQIKAIMSCNTFAYQTLEGSGNSLFIQASHANHSCIDNTYRSFTGDMVVLRAVNEIAAGTELTTSYWPAGLEEPNRHEALFQNWNFVCECKICESELQCGEDWEEIFKRVRKLLKKNYSNKKEYITKIEELVKRSESVYPCHLFKDLPRIAMQDLQSKLLELWVDLNDGEKIREHATALLREYGFRIEIADNNPRVQLKGPNGLLHAPVVKALYQPGRVSTDEDRKEYFALSKNMWLTMNGTSEGWKALVA
ncbi:unnamed protein product [Aureobasidium uvarum]|uniref:SET domain-containing protein n=1 Tax=Aureobasidium uvarum TaxID=2773716 RepID=A0A9N8KRS3_9PEZI|nr:unnamed protein product [Aureobasidium uvarum]